MAVLFSRSKSADPNQRNLVMRHGESRGAHSGPQTGPRTGPLRMNRGSLVEHRVSRDLSPDKSEKPTEKPFGSDGLSKQ